LFPALITAAAGIVARPLAVGAAVPAPARAVTAAARKAPKILAVDARIKNRVQWLRPSVKVRLARVVRRLPSRVTLLVTSAYRTTEEQRGLKSTFGVKAAAGKSPHEDGRAIDVNVLVDGERISPRRNQAVIGKVMAEAGFHYLGAADPVHYSLPKDAAAVAVADPPTLDVMTMGEAFEARAEDDLAGTAVERPQLP
jgi:hypothetical protein